MSTIPALIGLGSNLGDRETTLRRALDALASTPGVSLVAASAFHETEPVGGPEGQGPFLNAAALLRTTLDPFVLLRLLNAIEAESGRVRLEHWGARTLDLDLLLYGDRVIDAPDLVVPHPRFAARRFALAPAAEVGPEMIDPRSGRSVAELLAALEAA